MLIRSLVTIVIFASSSLLVTGQTPDFNKENAAPKVTGATQLGRPRDLPLAGGIDLQFLLKELGKDMGLNILFDRESRLENRKINIELRNVTPAAALNYVLLQEGLGFQEAGPKTILVATQSRLASIPKIDGGIAVLEAVAANTNGGTRTERMRDIPFAGGVDLQYLIKELAKDMGINVLFDAESRLENRKTRIELKNVTAAEALNYVVLQEGLVSEEAGPRAILVANRIRANSVMQIGVGTTPLTGQLAQYFGVYRGILINDVRDDSPGSKAGLRAGDVVVGIDGEPVYGTLGLMRVLGEKKENDIALKIVRERREQTLSLRLNSTAP